MSLSKLLDKNSIYIYAYQIWGMNRKSMSILNKDFRIEYENDRIKNLKYDTGFQLLTERIKGIMN